MNKDPDRTNTSVVIHIVEWIDPTNDSQIRSRQNLRRLQQQRDGLRGREVSGNLYLTHMGYEGNTSHAPARLLFFPPDGLSARSSCRLREAAGPVGGAFAVAASRLELTRRELSVGG